MNQTPQANISNRALLATLHVSVWHGNKRDRQITQEICAEKGASSRSIRANKSLVGDEIKPVRRAETAIRHEFHTHSLAWNDNATRILKIDAFADFRRTMAEPISRFHREVANFISIYPTVIENARRHLGSAWDPNDYPTQHEISRYFDVSLTYTPLPKADDSDFRASMTEEEARFIREDVERTIRTSIENAHSEILERLRAPLVRYAERLRLYQAGTETSGAEGIFRDTLVENVRTILDLAPRLNLADDPAITALCRTIRDDIAGHEPEALRASPDLRSASAARAEEIVDQINAMGF